MSELKEIEDWHKFFDVSRYFRQQGYESLMRYMCSHTSDPGIPKIDRVVPDCLFTLFLVQVSKADSDGKRWVWGDGGRRGEDRIYTGFVNGDRKYTGELVASSKPLFKPSSNFGGTLNTAQTTIDKLRYEVTEPPYIGVPDRPVIRPGGVQGGYQPIPDYNQPDNYRPPSGLRPPRPIENEYRPVGPGLKPGNIQGGYRPMTGPSGRPILTGPVPSWEQHNPNSYKEFDKCKCVHSFNCNTPGIKFGSCDIDKQYCCYKARGNEIIGNGPKPGNKGFKPRPVLAGPGGPIDGPQRPIQNQRPFRPFSEIDRYLDSDRDLDEAYKKGLESAIYELYDRPYEPENYSAGTYYKQNVRGYGLYEPSGYGGRSASANITAISESA